MNLKNQTCSLDVSPKTARKAGMTTSVVEEDDEEERAVPEEEEEREEREPLGGATPISRFLAVDCVACHSPPVEEDGEGLDRLGTWGTLGLRRGRYRRRLRP